MYDPFSTMGRGVHFCGEAKGVKPGVEGKPTLSITWIIMKREGRGLKGPVITGMTLETE